MTVAYKLLDQFERLGANVLTVTPQQSRSVAGRARTGSIVQTLVPADLHAIRAANVPMVRSSGTFSQAFLLKAGDLAKNNAPVIGVEPQFFAIKHWSIAEGEPFTADEDRYAARVALLGQTIARDLFGESAVGSRILINRVPFEVAGVLAVRGQGLDNSNEDAQIYVPLNTAMRRLANAEYYSSILIEIVDQDRLDAAQDQIRAILRKRHPRFLKLPEDFDVQNRKQLMDTQLAVSGRMYSYARWIGGCALALSGFAATAISWISVRERTKEIGVRRALGATQPDIFIQIVFEALSPAAAGCVAGVAIARQAALELAKIATQPAVFETRTAIVAASVSVALFALFALLPARAAARVDPIQALQFE